MLNFMFDLRLEIVMGAINPVLDLDKILKSKCTNGLQINLKINLYYWEYGLRNKGMWLYLVTEGKGYVYVTIEAGIKIYWWDKWMITSCVKDTYQVWQEFAMFFFKFIQT